jgi:hypothetical protein
MPIDFVKIETEENRQYQPDIIFKHTLTSDILIVEIKVTNEGTTSGRSAVMMGVSELNLYIKCYNDAIKKNPRIGKSNSCQGLLLCHEDLLTYKAVKST